MKSSQRPDPVTDAVADPWPDIIRQAQAKPLDTLLPGEMTVERLMALNPGMSAKSAGDTLLAAERKQLVTVRRVKLAQGRHSVKAYLPVQRA